MERSGRHAVHPVHNEHAVHPVHTLHAVHPHAVHPVHNEHTVHPIHNFLPIQGVYALYAYAVDDVHPHAAYALHPHAEHAVQSLCFFPTAMYFSATISILKVQTICLDVNINTIEYFIGQTN